MVVEEAFAKRISDDGEILDDASPDGTLKVVLKCQFTDRNYYTLDYLDDRYLSDIPEDADNTVLRGWKKLNGWRFNKLGNEPTNSIPVVGVTRDGSAFSGMDDQHLYITLDVPVDGDIDLSVYGGYWWLSFDELFTFRSPFSYVATPFIGLNAFLTSIGTSSTIMFDGIYVGSPLSMPVPRDTPVRLIEDYPVLFPNVSGVDFSAIQVSTAKAYRFISHAEYGFDEAEYILYERYDDESKAMLVRKGRMNFTRDVNEFLVHHDSGVSEIAGELSGDGASTQVVSVPASSVQDKDVVSVVVKKNDPSGYPAADADGAYHNTLWRMYHGDRLLGIESTSKKENSIYTRAAGRKTVSGVEDIPFYSNAEYFTGGQEVEYKVAGNTATGDPLAGTGSTFKFVPVLNPDVRNSKFASAKLKVVPSSSVIRNAGARKLFLNKGKAVIYVEQSQSSYLPSSSSEITEVRIVPGTESKRASDNVLPDISDIDFEVDGVFVLNTTDEFKSYSSGYFFRRGTSDGLSKSTMWRYPFLAVPNITQCSYSMAGDENGEAFLAIVHSQVHMMNSFNNPVFAYYSGETPLFLSSRVFPSRNIVIGTASLETVSPYSVRPDLAVEPLAVASSGKYKFLVFRSGTVLQWAMSSSDGTSWSFYDDITLTPASSVASSPSLLIYGDWLLMCYIKDKVELRMRKLPLPSLVKFHRRYNSNMVSSTDPSEAAANLREELQAELDNSFDVKITDTFDQQVSFSLMSDGLLRVVFFDNKGLVNAASSTTEGVEWNLTPVNF
jgi:hypothetical protein